MTPPSFHRLVDDYLRVRRGLGFDLESTEWKVAGLRQLRRPDRSQRRRDG